MGGMMFYWSSGVGCIAVGSVYGGNESVIYKSIIKPGLFHVLMREGGCETEMTRSSLCAW